MRVSGPDDSFFCSHKSAHGRTLAERHRGMVERYDFMIKILDEPNDEVS